MKYVAFDIGNVLCNVSFDKFLNDLSRTLNITLDDCNYFLKRTTKLHDLGLTVMGDELRDHFKIHSPVLIEDLLSVWNKTITVDPRMLSVINDLLRADTKMALLSNIGIEHAAIMRDTLTPNVFDQSIKFFSCDVGARKPNHLYYKTFLDMYPEFKNCVYVDDRIENVEAGDKFGFKSVHFALDKLWSEVLFDTAITNLKQMI